MARVNTSLPESNPGFQPDPNANKNGDENLQVKNANKKVWGQPVSAPPQETKQPEAPAKQEEVLKAPVTSGGMFSKPAPKQPEPTQQDTKKI